MAAAKLTDEEIIEAMRTVGGVRAATAHKIGISPRTLSRRLEKMRTVGCLDSEERSKIRQIEQTIFQKAIKGDFYAARYWLLRTSWAPKIYHPRVRESTR